MAGSEWNDPRPMSPHIWSWKWHVTMLTSILHRVTGVGNYLGAFVIVGWLLAVALGPEAYESYAGFLGSPIGLIILFGFTVSICYHLCNGIRHLFWDAGTGYDPAVANTTAVIVIAAGVILAVAIWAFILMMG